MAGDGNGNGNGNGNGKGRRKGSANGNCKGKIKGNAKGTMNVVVAGKAVNGALLNGALPCNVMSIHTMKTLDLKPTSSTSGVIRNVPVVVGTVRVVSTFRIWGLREDYYPLLLGAPYMDYVKKRLSAAAAATLFADSDFIEIPDTVSLIDVEVATKYLDKMMDDVGKQFDEMQRRDELVPQTMHFVPGAQYIDDPLTVQLNTQALHNSCETVRRQEDNARPSRGMEDAAKYMDDMVARTLHQIGAPAPARPTE